MNKNTKIILLSIISVLIIITIVLGITYSFMRPINETSSITSVNLESCANITLTDTGESINLSNSYPMTKNRALQTTPYTFTVSSSCTDGSGFNLYLATLNTNTLPDSSIHYIITEHGNKNVITEGILSEATNGLSDFQDYELNELNNGINGTYGSIYRLHSSGINYNTEVSYDLYLYIDESVTNETMGQTFSAGIAVKAGEYVPPTLADVCSNGETLSDCLIKYHDITGDNDNYLYYHDADLENGAGDNSYRYAGANPNNYVCFGSNASTCPSDNLYRIIGVFGSEVKLIKWDYANSNLLGTNGDYYGNYGSLGSYYKGSLSAVDGYYWNESGSNTWSASSLNTVNLNTNFLNNIGSTWSNLIATHSWKVRGITPSQRSNQPSVVYGYEVGSSSSSTTYSAKIGLMYISDYGFATANSNWTTALNNTSISTNNWMYMGMSEWTISRSSDASFVAFTVDDAGSVINYNVYYDFIAVRPSFYLNSSVNYVSGSGSSADPIRIS